MLRRSEEYQPEQADVDTGSRASVSPVDLPVIKAVMSTMDNVRAVFATPWGRTPRPLAEVVEALEANAVHDARRVVSTCLGRSVKAGELRRVKKEGKWCFYRIPQESAP